MTDTKFIAGDGKRDYNCDGGNDQDILNKALLWAASNPGSRIHLVGPHTFNIENQIFIGSNTILSGDPTAILKIPNMSCGTSYETCVFPDGKPVLTALPGGSPPTNIEITGFEFDGNCQNQALNLGLAHGKPSSAGSGVERLIGFKGSPLGTFPSNIKIHHMKFHDSFGEAAHFTFAKNIQIYDNLASNHEHDAFFCIETTGEKNIFRNNIIEGITDGCARFDNCSNWDIYENILLPYTGSNNNTAFMLGHNGLQIANESNKPSLTSNINIFNNKFVGPNLCGIWLNSVGKTTPLPQTVKIHHNLFTDEIAWSDWTQWSAGITVGPWGNGIQITNNTFKGCYNNAIQFNSSIVSGATAEVSFNNILNTKGSRTNSTTGPANVNYGIANFSNISVVAEGNYISPTPKTGNYFNIALKSEALEYLTDSTLSIDTSSTNYEVFAKCLESELSILSNVLTRKFQYLQKGVKMVKIKFPLIYSTIYTAKDLDKCIMKTVTIPGEPGKRIKIDSLSLQMFSTLSLIEGTCWITGETGDINIELARFSATSPELQEKLAFPNFIGAPGESLTLTWRLMTSDSSVRVKIKDIIYAYTYVNVAEAPQEYIVTVECESMEEAAATLIKLKNEGISAFTNFELLSS